MNALNAMQVTISIAVVLMMIIGFYAVAFYVIDINLYSRLLVLSAAILIAQMIVETLRHYDVIDF